MVQEGVLLNALIRQKVLPDMALNMWPSAKKPARWTRCSARSLISTKTKSSHGEGTHLHAGARDDRVGGRHCGIDLLAMYLPMFTVFDQIQ